MKATIAFMFLTASAYAAKVAQFLSDYSGTIAGLAGCVTIASGIYSMIRKRKD